MPRQFRQIDPLDLDKDQGVGIALPFGIKPVFTTTFETSEAIKNNLVSLLLTEPGERFLNPDLGTPLRSILFENLTQVRLQTVKEVLEDKIQSFFNRVFIEDLTLQAEKNSLLVSLKYSIKNTGIQDEVLVNIEV